MGRLAPKYIYRADIVDHYPNGQYWLEHAAKYHPAWHKCSYDVQRLHARNSLIMLGWQLNEPVDFVICWTKDGKASGGTGQALRIAEAYNIPIFNMHDPVYCDRLLKWLP
jgi:hypothetical protein